MFVSDFSQRYLKNPPHSIQNGVISTNGDTKESSSNSQKSTSNYIPFIFPPATYEIILCVDSRERIQTNFCQENRAAFASALQKQDIKLEVRTLPLGDFVWIAREKLQNNNNQEDMVRFSSIISDSSCSNSSSTQKNDIRKELVLDYIIERKRIDDLASSIKDRRWIEQKNRLKNCGLRRPTYLIEYCGKQSRRQEFGGLKPETLEQAMANCQIDGFDVKRTDNFEETIRYLTFMTRWLIKHYQNRTLMSAQNKQQLFNTVPADYRYISFNEFAYNSTKLATFTTREMFAKHLLQIRGLSVGKVASIVYRYPTLRRLIEEYDRFGGDVRNREKLLQDLKQNDYLVQQQENYYSEQQQTIITTGTNQRLGPVASKKVHDFYFSID